MKASPRHLSRAARIALAAHHRDAARGATLPAPDGWDLDGYTGGVWVGPNGRAHRVMARIARPALAQGVVKEISADHLGRPVVTVVRVWKVETHPALRVLAPELRQALEDYAIAFETAAGGIKGQNLSGMPGGSGSATAPCPSDRAIAAAHWLRRADAALHGREFSAVTSRRFADQRATPVPRLSFCDLVRAAAVEGLDAPAILARAAAGNPVAEAEVCPTHAGRFMVPAVNAALRDAALILAVLQGYVPDCNAISAKSATRAGGVI